MRYSVEPRDSKEIHSQNNLKANENKTKYQKKDMYLSRKKTINYWWIKISIII